MFLHPRLLCLAAEITAVAPLPVPVGSSGHKKALPKRIYPQLAQPQLFVAASVFRFLSPRWKL